jgi:chemotaxis protein MotB
MNMRLILNLLAFFVLVSSFQSCISKKKYDELMASKEASDRALAETQSQVQTLQTQNQELTTTLESEKQRLNGELASLRTDLNNTKTEVANVQQKLNMTQEELNKFKAMISGAFDKYKNSGLTLEEREGRFYVMTKAPIEYRIGSANLTRDERQALDELAGILKSNPELRVLVEGHTDNLQYPAGSGMDNWNLSVNRATEVVRQLLRAGVSPNQVAAAGRGEMMPAASNDTPEGRSKNRRTVVRPDVEVDGLMKSQQ